MWAVGQMYSIDLSEYGPISCLEILGYELKLEIVLISGRTLIHGCCGIKFVPRSNLSRPLESTSGK